MGWGEGERGAVATRLVRSTAERYLFQEISDLACSPENAGALIPSLKSPRVKSMLDEFLAQSFQENVNFMFWWNYMELVSIHLMFTRAQRERGYGTCNWPSELCKMGISVHFRDESVAKESFRRVQEGRLRCQMEWKQVQPGQSRSQPWMTEWDRKKRWRNPRHNPRRH